MHLTTQIQQQTLQTPLLPSHKCFILLNIIHSIKNTHAPHKWYKAPSKSVPNTYFLHKTTDNLRKSSSQAGKWTKDLTLHEITVGCGNHFLAVSSSYKERLVDCYSLVNYFYYMLLLQKNNSHSTTVSGLQKVTFPWKLA